MGTKANKQDKAHAAIASDMPYIESCQGHSDAVLLRALYLSWRKASRETPMERFNQVVRPGLVHDQRDMEVRHGHG